MFRNLPTSYTERVDIIGNKAFLDFVEDLERLEELKLDTFEVGKDKVVIVTIAPDPAKLDKDIALPQLSPILTRKKSLGEEIAALDKKMVELDEQRAQRERAADEEEARRKKAEDPGAFMSGM